MIYFCASDPFISNLLTNGFIFGLWKHFLDSDIIPILQMKTKPEKEVV